MTDGAVAVPEGWRDAGTRIVRTYRFGGFPEAMAFMVEVGLHCERVGHHPDWTNVHDRLEVELTTHDAGRVTEKDVKLAAHMDAVFRRYGAKPGSV